MLNRKSVLIVDDDEITLKLIRYTLEDQGISVIGFTEGKAALDYISSHPVDAAILDLYLPDIAGLEILKAIRALPRVSHIPIIILTSNGDKIETILALEMGADDYILKPFHKRELVARLNVGFRRLKSYTAYSSILSFDDLTIDVEKRIVIRNGLPITLTFNEFKILHLLAANAGMIFSRDKLLTYLWGEDYIIETRTVDMHISSLRRKLGDLQPNISYIETVRGIGYRFRKVSME